MIPTNNEHYDLELIKRKPNSPYLYEDAPTCAFKGRPANQAEKRVFRIQKGVNGNTDSVFVYSTNMPENIEIKDKIIFMGKEWIVNSIGYYFEAAHIVNPGCLSEEQIIARCPKGLNLQ